MIHPVQPQPSSNLPKNLSEALQKFKQMKALQPKPGKDYRIQSGDTLENIVAQAYDLQDKGLIAKAARIVANDNNIDDPNQIIAGKKIELRSMASMAKKLNLQTPMP